MPDIKGNRKKVYDALSSRGFTGIGKDADEFSSLMDKEENRKKVYDALSSKGFTGIGKDYDEFSSLIYQPQTINVPIVDEPEKKEFEFVDDISQKVAELERKYGPPTSYSRLPNIPNRALEPLPRDAVNETMLVSDRDWNLKKGLKSKVEAQKKALEEKERNALKKTGNPFLDKLKENDVKLQKERVAEAEKELYGVLEGSSVHEPDYLTQTAQAFEETAAGVVNMAGYIIGAFGGDETEKSLKEMTDEWVSNNYQDKNFLIQMIPDAVGAAATLVAGAYGGPPAAQVVGSTWFGTQLAAGAGNSMREAEKYGASTGEMWTTGIGNAAVNYFTERIPLNRMLGKIPVKFKKGGGVGVPGVDADLEKLRKAIKESKGVDIKEVMATALEEGGTEAIAGVSEEALKMVYQNPEDYANLTDYFNAAMESFAGGALLGGGVGTTQSAMQNYANDKQRKKAGYVTFSTAKVDGQDVFGEVLGKDEDGKIVMLVDGQYQKVDKVGKGISMTYEQYKNNEYENWLNQSYNEGVTGEVAMQKAKALMDADKKVRDIFGLTEDIDLDEVLPTLDTEEETKGVAVEEYRQAKAGMEGVQLAYEDILEMAYQESDESVDKNVNKYDTAWVYSTIYNGEEVFITGGKVVLNEDDTIDGNDSSDTLYIKFPDGTVIPVSTGELTEKVSVADAEELKAAGRAAIDEQWKSMFDTAEADAVEQEKRAKGVVFNMTDPEGTHRIEILNEGNDISDILLDGVPVKIFTDELNQWKQEAGIQTESGELKGENGNVQTEGAMADNTTDNVAPTAPVAPVELPNVPDFFRLGGKNYSVASRNNDGSVDVMVDGKRETLPAGTDYSALMPTDKKGEVQYEQMPVERTHEYFVQRVKDDEARAEMIEKRRKKAEAERKKFDKKPDPGIDPDAYDAKMTQWEADKKAAQAKVDYWNEVAKREAGITRSETREAVEGIQPRDVVEQTAEEFIANQLGGNGIMITPESFREETGAKSEQKQLVGILSNDGVSIERASEIIWDNYSDELRNLGFKGDQQDVRDAIINILSQGNPRGYAKRGYEARVQDDIDQQRADAEAWAKGAFDMKLEELYLYEETILPRIMRDYEGFDENEYYSNLAENYENDTTRESESIGRGGEVLQGEQPVPAGGTPVVGQRNEGGAVSDDVQGGGQNGVAQGNQQVSGSEIPNNQNRDNVSPVEGAAEGENAPGQSGVEEIQEPVSVEDIRPNGDRRITNYNSRGEVATVATERDGKVVSVDSYDEGVLFEHTEYDGNGKAASVTRYDKQGNVVGTQVYEDGKAKTPMQKLADRILDKTEEKRRIPLRERARELEAQVGVKANIIESLDEVKNSEARKRIAAGEAVAGWYSGGQVYLYMPNIKDRREIELTYVHEVVAHHGVKKLLGERFNEFLDGVWNMMSEADRARMLAYVGANETPTLQDMRAAADEYVAELAEKMNLGELEQSTWEKIVDWFKELLENIGFENLTKEDIESMLKASYANLRSTEQGAESTENGFRARMQEDAESKKIFETAKEIFGTTYDMREAGYILPDGTMLDFSGKHQVRGVDNSFLNGGRTVDHREIEDIAYDFDENPTGVSTDMGDFLDRGAIRIDYNVGAINLNTAPTAKQKALLKRLIERNDGDVTIDFGKGWDTEHYAEYESARASRVLGDIDRYYSEGIKPGGNTMFRIAEVQAIEEADKVFNEELDAFKEKSHKGLLHLGSPMRILLSAGVNAEELTLSPTVLFKHLKKQGLTTDDLKGLAKAIQTPILVYEHGENYPNIVVVTELDVKGGKLSIALELDDAGNVVEVSNVSSVHSKDAVKELERLSVLDEETLNRNLRWVEKEKVSEWLGLPYEEERQDANPKLISVANVINNFENPTIESENSSENPQDSESGIRFRKVTDPLKVAELEAGEKMKVYRAMQVIDGKLYPPMSAKVDGKLREPIELGVWEEAEERPELADDKGYFRLDKGNKKSLKARYNPYIHTSTTPLNDQFSEAQERPNLVTVEVEIPVSELTSGYKAEKAKDAVGRLEWKAGVVQGKLSGTRTVILSRWDKPVRIVPDSEVADVIVEMFGDREIVMPSNVVTPSLRAELEKRGVPFVETNNQGKPVSAKPMTKEEARQMVRELVVPFAKELREEQERAQATEEGGTRFRITPEMDAEYVAAVENGDMETAERLVKEAAKLAMPDTKIVDEDGYPMVVYHGSEEDFNVFDKTKGRANMDIQGMFFSPWDDDARGYGSNVRAFYLNITKPANESTGYKALNKFQGQNGAGIKAREYLVSAGYDGVNNEDQEFVAFDPNQIKSAEAVTYDDNGNVIPLSERFNEEKEDIRFRVANRNQDIFVSNAQRAVEGIKQEKATPEQWLAMLQKNGGLKAGEDKWLGLSEWLNEKQGAVTKQEILDYIGENRIQIEEVKYGESVEGISEETVSESEEFGNLASSLIEYDEEDYPYVDRERFEQLRNEDEDFLDGFSIDYWGEGIEVNDPEAAARYLGLTEGSRPINSTRLEYTTDGLENKREIVLVVPTVESWNASDEIHFGDAGEGRAVAWVRFGETTVYETVEDVQEVTELHEPYRGVNGHDIYKPVGSFRSGDYIVHGKAKTGEMIYVVYINDKQIPIAHATLEEARNAMNEYYREHPRKLRKPVRVLVIDEIQSKRHQEGREKGYRSNADKFLKDNSVEIVETDTHFEFYKNGEVDKRFAKGLFNTDIEKAKNLYVAGYEKTAIPSAPFEKNWHELAMKRMLRLAAEEGFDKVAWTTGEQQAERYSLGTYINSIERFDVDDRGKRFELNGPARIGMTVGDDGVVIASSQGEYEGKPLSDVVGKELAEKMLAMENRAKLEDLDLKVGGEGMKGFYDRMLPSFVQKYTKKWGAKVGEVTMPELGENNTMWSVDVTPEMQESVMQGQTMFRFIGKKGAENLDKAEEATTRLDNLVVAREMESAGKEAKAIKLATGWERGADGKWRYEAEDAKVNRAAKLYNLETLESYPIARSIEIGRVDDNSTIRLTDLVKDDELFKAYPEMEEYFVSFEKMDAGTEGSHSFEEKMIRINKDDIHSLESTLVHEIQHAIQSIEGFAKGGSASSSNGLIQEVLKTLHVDSENAAPSLSEVISAVENGYITRSEHEELVKIAQSHGYDDAVEYVRSLSPYSYYRRIAGEVEARNVQERMGMSPEERRSKLAEETEDVRREDQIFMYDNLGVSASEVAEEDIPVESVQTQPMTLMERITNSLLEVSAKNKENLGLRADALRTFGRDINRVLSLMKAQREYDKSTVDTLVKLAKMYFKNAQLLGEVDTYTMGRVLSLINNVVGKKDVTASAAKLMDILLDAHTKALAGILEKAEKVKAKKVNAAGVEVMGRLDKYGQRRFDEYRAAKEMTPEKLEEAIYDSDNRLAELEQRVRKELGLPEGDVDQAARDYTGDNDVVNVYMDERARLEGLTLAREYKESIQQVQEEIKDLKRELKQAEEDYRLGNIDGKSLKEFRKSVAEAIMESKAGLIEGYHSLIYKFQENTKESSKRAKAFAQAQIDRAREIQHNANSDMEGISAATQGNHPENYNNAVMNALRSPFPTFQGILKKFGEKNVEGKGYLYERFIPQATKAGDNEFRGKVAARVIIEGKLKEIYGKEMTIAKFMKQLREHGATVTYREGNEMKQFDLTKGQMLYIYMVNKMSDGQMKLRRMGITDDVVAELMTKLPEEAVQFADWAQNELLKDLRGKYNAVHERVFGAPMAAIENYFPIKIRKEARGEKGDVSEVGQEGKPSTVTGSIIKRTKNATAIDLSADAMQVLMEHIDDMEHWAAFAEFNRDLNVLLNYKHFQNQVKNMTSVRYGSGTELWKNFRKTAQIVSGTYRPSDSSIDRAVQNIAKGLTRSKINFRLFTAVKQLLSAPAFWTDAGVEELAYCYANPKGSFEWAKENLPGFAERWQGRTMGNEKLLKSDSDWELWRNEFVEKATRWGMTPNAAIDALTVAQGARAVYMTKLEQFKKAGYTEQRANEKALQAAAEAYNESQQSSEGVYLSPLQVEGTVASAIFSTFKNSNFGYTRKTAQAIANIKRKMRKGYKEETIAFMTKQMVRDGLSEENAKKMAERVYKKSKYKDVANVAMFGFGLNLLWEAGGYAIYLLLGDDDEEKEKMMKEIALRGSLGSLNGIPFGETMISTAMAVKEGDTKYFRLPQLIAVGDIENLAQVLNYDPVRGANDIVNMLTSMGVGVTPQVLTDILVALDDVEEFSAEELGMLAARFVNAPQSNLDRLMVDDAMENSAINAEEIMLRYAEYKKSKNAPITQFLYSDEEEQKAVERYEKRFAKLLDERLENVVEDNDAYDLFYENADVKMKSKLAKMRQKYLAGDKAKDFEKLDAKELVERVLYGSGEINETYFNLSTAEDEDAALAIKFELKKHEDIYNKGKDLMGEEWQNFEKANSKEYFLYEDLKKIERDISKEKTYMEEHPEEADEAMEYIREQRAEAIKLINEYYNE